MPYLNGFKFDFKQLNGISAVPSTEIHRQEKNVYEKMMPIEINAKDIIELKQYLLVDNFKLITILIKTNLIITDFC